jgi:hypothetical protein
VSDILKRKPAIPPPAGERRDYRPPSLRYQDAAILEYAVRNRLLRGSVSPADQRGDAQPPEASRAGRMRRRPRKGALRAAARAEDIYRRIAPPGQRYPLQAVALVRRLLHEGAPDEFVEGKYKTHTRCCDEFGLDPMPLIPYLAELLEVFLLDRKAARRTEAI